MHPAVPKVLIDILNDPKQVLWMCIQDPLLDVTLGDWREKRFEDHVVRRSVEVSEGGESNGGTFPTMLRWSNSRQNV